MNAPMVTIKIEGGKVLLEIFQETPLAIAELSKEQAYQCAATLLAAVEILEENDREKG